MRRKSLIAVLVAIMVLACTAFSYAATGLELTASYPEDGQKGTSIENLGVKLSFNNAVNSKAAQKVNKKAIKLIDEDGKKVPVQVLFSDDEEGLVLVVLDADKNYTVKNNADYKCVISDKFVDNNGNTLEGGKTITFKTYNQKLNNWVNMLMMVVMFGGIMLVSVKQQKNQEEDAKEEAVKKSIDPYREAKRTGKSVEEIKAEIAKQEEKDAKRRARKHKNDVPEEKHIDNCAELLNNVYHVHAPAPTNKEDRSVAALNKIRRAEKAAAKAEKAEREAKAAKKRAKKK